MKQKKISKALTLLVLCTVLPTQTSDDGTRLAIIGVVGGVAGALGLYSMCNWLCTESDEDVLSAARQRMVAYQNDYATMDSALKLRLQELAISPSDQSRYAQNVDEALLYALATTKHNKATIAVYRSQLESGLRDVRSSHDKLLRRIPTQKEYALCERMQQTANELKILIDSLALLDRILSTHQSYFDLYELESKIALKYGDECKVLTEYYGNRDHQALAIRHFVITQSKTSSLPFARVEYRKLVERDIAKLERAINKSAYNYQGRIGSARLLLDALKSIKSYIITDGLYSQEVVNYERDQREKERIRIERDKADAERRKAAAAERKARAEQDRAWAEEQRARAELRKARAKEEENFLKRQERAERRDTVRVVF